MNNHLLSVVDSDKTPENVNRENFFPAPTVGLLAFEKSMSMFSSPSVKLQSSQASVPSVSNRRISRQCPTARDPQSIPALPNRRVSQ